MAPGRGRDQSYPKGFITGHRSTFLEHQNTVNGQSTTWGGQSYSAWGGQFNGQQAVNRYNGHSTNSPYSYNGQSAHDRGKYFAKKA